ncbi:DUF3305 domain-containing protein [Litoreibacter albidus]|uniref:Molybdopterin-guanine dinucleotide biosynthesis protein A n=1 Tax=Litoreibacter albidus TaxID=670155 RepID=A0A1H2Z4P9_9RHOB|nr:DUF3305 domain-containing protein [Litoreibacter albidus]SDX12336.1 Protein of unknown function [Litoreibacter albidus]
MSFVFPNSQSIPVGVVIRKSPGVTRWAKWAWRAIDMLPGAGPADWTVLRRDGDSTEFHAATLPLELYVSDTEAYVHELQTRQPSIYVVLSPNAASTDIPWKVSLVTASPYEAQDYCDSSEVLVEKLPMPEGMQAWVGDFVSRHHEEDAFVKRKRRNWRDDDAEDGIGDPRISKDSDVYSSPRRRREALN